MDLTANTGTTEAQGNEDEHDNTQSHNHGDVNVFLEYLIGGWRKENSRDVLMVGSPMVGPTSNRKLPDQYLYALMRTPTCRGFPTAEELGNAEYRIISNIGASLI